MTVFPAQRDPVPHAQCLQPIRAERIRARRTPDPAYDAFFFGLHGQGQTFHLEAFGESGERTAVEANSMGREAVRSM